MQPSRLRIVVTDAGPLHYPILIGEIELLHDLAGEVLVPFEVRDELDHPRTPAPVRTWMAAPPPWLRVRPTPPLLPGGSEDPALAKLGPGERAAIRLAEAVSADAVVIDDRAGTAVARARRLEPIGTLGLLQRGARRGLLHLRDALGRLTATNFHVRQELLDRLLAEEDHHSREVGSDNGA